MKLEASEIVALSKVVAAKDARAASAELAPGEHEVDFVVRVTGSLKRGEDYDQRIVLKADPWTVLVAALSHLNGVTVDSLVREALNADPALVKSIKKMANEAMEKLNKPTTTHCNGKVGANVAAEPVAVGGAVVVKSEE